MNNAARYKEDRFDIVHDCQRIFRTLMMAMAFPGRIRQLDPVTLSNISKTFGFVIQPLLTLLDLETGYYIHTMDSQLKQKIDNYLETNTTSSPCDPESADFILSLEPSAKKIFTSVKKGTLFCPNQGATLLYHVDEITCPADRRDETFTLTGPGIKDMASLTIKGLDPDEPTMWKTSRKDYPTGIDIFLVSTTGDIVGIPRSVNIIEPGVN